MIDCYITFKKCFKMEYQMGRRLWTASRQGIWRIKLAYFKEQICRDWRKLRNNSISNVAKICFINSKKKSYNFYMIATDRDGEESIILKWKWSLTKQFSGLDSTWFSSTFSLATGKVGIYFKNINISNWTRGRNLPAEQIHY